MKGATPEWNKSKKKKLDFYTFYIRDFSFNKVISVQIVF